MVGEISYFYEYEKEFWCSSKIVYVFQNE